MILPGASALPPAMQLSLLLASNGPNFMDCRTAPLCGVVTLETGLGGGKYQHDQPVVHGLWPQVGKYGSSSCTALEMSAKAEWATALAEDADNKNPWLVALGKNNVEWISAPKSRHVILDTQTAQKQLGRLGYKNGSTRRLW